MWAIPEIMIYGRIYVCVIVLSETSWYIFKPPRESVSVSDYEMSQGTNTPGLWGRLLHNVEVSLVV